MTNKDIKDVKIVMKDWYQAIVNREDNSYFKLYEAMRVLRSANLITEEQWKEILNYDEKLWRKEA